MSRQTGLVMTSVGALAPAVCDGRAAPTWCSGLALLTRLPVLETDFTAYSGEGINYQYSMQQLASQINRMMIFPPFGKEESQVMVC